MWGRGGVKRSYKRGKVRGRECAGRERECVRESVEWEYDWEGANPFKQFSGRLLLTPQPPKDGNICTSYD